MKCVKCGKPASIQLQNSYACESCFLKIIEKRVRKEIRIKKLIKKNDKILIIDDGSAAAKLSAYLLKKIIKDLPVKIKSKKLKYTLGEDIKGDFDKVLVPWSADKEDEYFLSLVFENKDPKYLGHFTLKKKRYLKIFLHVLDEEIIMYADIKKLDYKKSNSNTKIGRLLEKLEKDYPDTKFSLLKSIEEIKKK